jgi:pimeloyl-ACP methyl ester carboxylesterase
MTSWQSSNVAANGIHLHVTRTGGEKPALVLVHGVTDSGLCWSPVAARLATDYDVVMVDARGHGQSDAPEDGYDLITLADDLADDLAGVVQALELDRPLFIGHSLGAVTTLVMAARHPDVPRAIVLEDPPAWWVRSLDSESLPRSTGIRDWVIELKNKTREQILAEGRAQNPLWSEAELAPWADSKVDVSADAMVRLFTPNHTAGIVWDELLRCITCPALALTAELSLGGALAPAGVEALRLLVPQLHAVHIADAGHNIRREQFARYMDAVSSFLAVLPH